MSLDIFRSRRGYYEYCRWWTRKIDDNIENSELVSKKVPSGYFYAKEVGSESNNDNAITNVMLAERDTVVIKSPDNLTGIKVKDIVEFRGDFWRVKDVYRRRTRVQGSQFMDDKDLHYVWQLSLRR